MWTQMQTSKLINMAVNRYYERFGKYPFPERGDTIEDKAHNFYTTSAGIQFTWSMYKSKSQQFKFDTNLQTISPIGTRSTPFVNPLVNVKILWFEIAQIRSLHEFIYRFKNGSKGINEYRNY